MKLKISLLFVFIGFVAGAQSIDILEEKNGYKTIKLNTHKSEYNVNLSYLESSNGYTTYRYTGGSSTLYDLFGEKINSIELTFDNATNNLKKIALNINQIKSSQWLTVAGFNLKKLYMNFAEIIGSTTEYPKPTADCYRNVHQSCAYFEERIFEGKILWKSNNVVLEIFHNADFDLQQNGMINLKIDKVISFSEKEYYNLIKLSGF